MNNNSLSAKPHYPILDGLRGVAAILVHYPLVYFYVAWISNHKGVTIVEAWPRALLILIGGIILAYASLKWYDEPARKWLRKKLGRNR